MSQSRRARWDSVFLRLLAVLSAVAVGVVGCARSERPIISEPDDYGGGTLVEHLLWLEGETDRAIAASGVESGWLYLFDDGEVLWGGGPRARFETLGSMLPRACGDGGRIVSDLIVRDVPNAASAAARVRSGWEQDGWTVTDVFEPAASHRAYFRAAREDGALLTCEATNSTLTLTLASDCSLDPTMSPRLEDLSERDAFLEHIMTGERP